MQERKVMHSPSPLPEIDIFVEPSSPDVLQAIAEKSLPPLQNHRERVPQLERCCSTRAPRHGSTHIYDANVRYYLVLDRPSKRHLPSEMSLSLVERTPTINISVSMATTRGRRPYSSTFVVLPVVDVSVILLIIVHVNVSVEIILAVTLAVSISPVNVSA